MQFDSSYITTAGSALFARATASTSGGTSTPIVWGSVYTSSVDMRALQPEQIRALTSIPESERSSSGSVTSARHDIIDGNHVAKLECEIKNEQYSGIAYAIGVYAKLQGDADEVLAAIARVDTNGSDPDTVPASGDYWAIIDFILTVRDDQLNLLEAPASYYASAQALQKLTNRVVTTHVESSDTIGEQQDVYGVKTFKNDTKHSGNILPTANNLNIGENTTDGRWDIVYASTFDGNATTATDATNLTYINGSTKTTKLSATNTNYIISYDDIVPNASNAFDLGSTSWQWKHIYASGSSTSDGYLIIGNSENGNAYPSIRPSQNGKGWLGFSNYKFSGVWANGFYGDKFNGTLVEDTAHSIFGIIEDGSTGPFYNGTCSTASSTTTKVVDCSGFSLSVGAVITVLFTNASSLSSPSLNVNSTGAKPVEAGSDIVTWNSNSFKTFRYSGTKWIAIKTHLVSNYGVCSTASDTAAKAVTVSNKSFKLERGARVIVKFTYYNSASNPTLNVNGTGAKSIAKYSNVVPGNSAIESWVNGSTLEFVYDGTSWAWLGYQYYAGSSLNIGILGTNGNSSYPLVFTSNINSSTSSRLNGNLYTDTVNSLYYNPSSNTLTCTTFNGNATSATYTSTIKYNSSADKSFYVSSTSELLCQGNIRPHTSYRNSLNLGSTTERWKDIYVSGSDSSHYFEIGTDTVDGRGEPVIRPNESNYGYIGTPNFHLYYAYIRNVVATNSLNIEKENITISGYSPSLYIAKLLSNGYYDTSYQNSHPIGSIRLAGLWTNNSADRYYDYATEAVSAACLYQVCFRTDSKITGSVSMGDWDCQLEIRPVNLNSGNGTWKILGCHPAAVSGLVNSFYTEQRMHLVLVIRVA